MVYRGGQVMDVCRPLEQMPVFLKAGAIVPMQAHEPGEKTLGNREHMELYVAPGANGGFTLIEDDGESLDYREGKVSKTHFEFKWSDKEAELQIAAADDAAGVLPERRCWTVHFIGFAPECTFELDGKTVETAYCPQRHEHTVTVELAAKESAQIVLHAAKGLMHRGEDAINRCIDLLTRAQIPLSAKILLHEKLAKAMERMENGQNVLRSSFGSDRYKTLGLACYEQMTGGARE